MGFVQASDCGSPRGPGNVTVDSIIYGFEDSRRTIKPNTHVVMV